MRKRGFVLFALVLPSNRLNRRKVYLLYFTERKTTKYRVYRIWKTLECESPTNLRTTNKALNKIWQSNIESPVFLLEDTNYSLPSSFTNKFSHTVLIISTKLSTHIFIAIFGSLGNLKLYFSIAYPINHGKVSLKQGLICYYQLIPVITFPQKVIVIHSIFHVLPAGQPVGNKCIVQWLRVFTRTLSAGTTTPGFPYSGRAWVRF